MAHSSLAQALEDTLYGLREQLGSKAFPKSATEYLNDWAANDKGWLRKFYPAGSDEAHFDLTPSTERALAWLGGLSERSFVGTESRLLTLLGLLKQMSDGSETNPRLRLAELQKQRDAIDAEMVRVTEGDMTLMGDTAVKDRFQQFTGLARDLLADFREVEHNFRVLDRKVRERITLWDGAKGSLLQEIMGDRDAIAESDQGKSFRAFWDFLMSQSRQEEFTELLARVLDLPPVLALSPDVRLKRVHYDWLEAGEYAQRTVAQLSQQLRRFLDDKAWLENRRIMDILRGIEGKALGLRDASPTALRTPDFMQIDEIGAGVELALERPLFQPSSQSVLTRVALQMGDTDLDSAALFAQVRVDKAALSAHIRQSLQIQAQVTLTELLQARPLQQGLGELLAYLQLASESPGSVVDESSQDVVAWAVPQEAGGWVTRRARLPRVIFVRD